LQRPLNGKFERWDYHHPKEHRAEIAHVDPTTACFTLEKMLGFIGRLLPMACR
jgi:hypothetical protein